MIESEGEDPGAEQEQEHHEAGGADSDRSAIESEDAGSSSFSEEEQAEDDTNKDEEEPRSKRGSGASKHELPQSSAVSCARQHRFPKIPKSERCGACENCLNPQRKKACIVVRQGMEQQLKQQQAGSSSGTPKAHQPHDANVPKPNSAPAAAATAPAAAAMPAAVAAEDPFARSFTSILSSSGGVSQERYLTVLLQLVKRATTKPHRIALLTVLQLSAPEVLRQAVAGGLLLELQAWLSEFVAEGKQAMVQRALGCLDKLPVTLASLQPPCVLGKIVGRLRKHEVFGSPVIEPAKRLVARWKAMVDQAVKGKASSSGSGPSLATQAGNAAGGGQSLDRQSSGGVTAAAAMVDDGDLFRSADRQRAGIKDAVPSAKKTVAIKTLTVEPTRGGKPAGDTGQAPSAAAAGSTASEQAGASGKVDSCSASSVPGRTDICKVSASPFASLGSLGVLGSLGSGVTVLGGGSSGVGMPLSTVGPSSSSAKERATAAARRVPSPEPQPRKEKKKKVAWLEGEALVWVRWFRKDDPPAAAQKDVDLTQPAVLSAVAPAAATREASPPGFESAAKKEHLSEAEALRRHREEEDQERHELERRLALMMATTAWLNPLQNDVTSPAELEAMAAPPGCGEDSAEAAAAAARRQQVADALYASLAAVPPSPAEPGAMVDNGVVQHASTIPCIPLSLEEAAAIQPQQQQEGGPSHAVQALLQQQPQQLPQTQQQHSQPEQPIGGQSAVLPLDAPPQHLPSGVQQQQQQPQGQGAQSSRAMCLPDIGAALAQLAASGVLNALSGTGPGIVAKQPPPRQQQGVQGPAVLPGRPPPPPEPPRDQHLLESQAHGRQPPPPPPPLRRPHGQRPCRYFNAPQGWYMGNRCNFAHLTPTNRENGRGQVAGAGGTKRPAEADYGRAGKQHRGADWGNGRP